MASLNLNIEIFDWWHSGGGRGAGSHLDAVVDLEDGLPYVPGRQLKGLLREACRCIETWEHPNIQGGSTLRLFGRPAGTINAMEDRHASSPGFLQVDSARLPADLRAALQNQSNLKAAMFGEIFSTALTDYGSAQPKSLRGIQVTVPLRLEARITGPDDDDWQSIVRRCLPLVRAVGAHRSRGLGRCHIQEISHV